MSRPMVIDGPVTQVDSTPDIKKLGLTRMEWDSTYGWREWIYVQVDAAGALAAGNSVKRKNATNAFTAIVGTAATPRPAMLGVAQHAIAASSGGWILKRGLGTVLDSGSGLTANTGLTFAAAGTFADGAIGTNDLAAYSGAAVSASATGIALIQL